jgi:DNA-binding winged helix-turn-helix (wHTH) protein
MQSIESRGIAVTLMLVFAIGGAAAEPVPAAPDSRRPKNDAEDSSNSPVPAAALTRLRKLGAEIDGGTGSRHVALMGNATASSVAKVNIGGKTLKGQRVLVRRGEPKWKGTDADLELLAEIGDIFILQISGTLVTDAGMANIGRLPNIENLILSHLEISNTGLAEVKNLENLQTLEIRASLTITDDGLAALVDLPALYRLSLPYTNITDAGLRHVKRIAALNNLSMRNCRISDKGLAELRELHALDELDLHETDVTDDGMTHLAALESLRSLDLTGTKVGDKGVEQLVKLQGLEHLALDDTKVTNKSALHLARVKLKSLKLGETELDELLSVARNLLARQRRVHGSLPTLGNPAAETSVYSFVDGRASVNFDTYKVTVEGREAQLTALEMKLLRYFIEHEGSVVTRAELLENVWGMSHSPTTRTVDNFIVNLRKHFEPDPSEPRHFLSVRGTGYRFVATSESPAEKGEGP